MRALVARAVRAAGHELIAETGDIDEAVIVLAREKPDALVLDGRLPAGSLSDGIARLVAASSATAIFVLATLDERDLVRAAIVAGARGALLRPIHPQAIADALVALRAKTSAGGEDS